MSGRWPAVRGRTVGGGADEAAELAAAPGLLESDEHAASASDAADPMRKLRLESPMRVF
jgi:hypothetical protein